MEYVDLIKRQIDGIIKKSAKQPTGRQYFDTTLFRNLKNNISIVAKLEGLPDVDGDKLFEYYETAVSEWLSTNPIEVEQASSIVKEGYESWLNKERVDCIKWHYTDRYIRMLKEKGRAKDVIRGIEHSTQDILSKMGDPKAKAFYSQGLVVGSVQSGKTENFNGVINRAVDAGYKMIIVLSGIMDDLRIQTQKRIELDVVGEGIIDERTNANGPKGVGLITNFFQRPDIENDKIQSITSHKSDFSRALADANFNVNFLNILVCKKNVSILKNLLLWLKDNPRRESIPLLIIDDEADNASLNNQGHKGKEYASRINKQLRALLAQFERKTYLGYTATPFANVLQDRNEAPKSKLIEKVKIDGETIEKEFPLVPNIFPEDFIVLLDSPSNYVGAKHIFETLEPINNDLKQKIPLYVAIHDNIEAFPSRVYENNRGELVGIHNYRTKEEFEHSDLVSTFGTYAFYKSETSATTRHDDYPKALPKSLKDAVACFIISIAIRDYRKPKMQHSNFFNPHNTMLVHVSRFIPWQNKTKKLLKDYCSDIQKKLLSDNPESDDSVYSYFKSIWYKHYARIIEDICNYLPDGYEDPFMSPLSFVSIKHRLIDAIEGLGVKVLNSSRDGEKLSYTDNNPQKVIAVGGNRLSRGFTLEGLSINYFCRQTNYSDTLLQMGRWFGYRPGYLDCCKIFTTDESIESFDLTTKTIEELEGEFRKMADSPKKNPSNFALRVRKHPGALRVTRPSILKNATTVKWSYQDTLVQTPKFDVTKAALDSSWTTFQDCIVKNRRFLPELNQGFIVSEKKAGADEIANFVEKIKNLDSVTRKSLARYIKLCSDKGKLSEWTIAIKATGQGQNLDKAKTGLQRTVNLVVRKGPDKRNSLLRDDFISKCIFRSSGRSANIITGGKDLAISLSDDKIEFAENSFRKNKKNALLMKHPDWSEAKAEAKAIKTNIPEHVYREKIEETEGVLLIYLIDPKEVFFRSDDDSDTELRDIATKEEIDLEKPLVGYAIGIPPIQDDNSGEYLQSDIDIIEEDEIIDDEDSELPEEFLTHNEL